MAGVYRPRHPETKPEAERVKGRAFDSPLARDLYPRASTAEVDPRAMSGVPAAVGKYMLRPVLALERLMFMEPDGKVDPMLCPKCDSFAVLMVCMSAVE